MEVKFLSNIDFTSYTVGISGAATYTSDVKPRVNKATTFILALPSRDYQCSNENLITLRGYIDTTTQVITGSVGLPSFCPGEKIDKFSTE